MAKRKVEEVAWAGGPPAKKVLKVPIRRPKTAQVLRFIVLDHVVTAVWTHWIGGRTQPCLGPGCECANWAKGQNQRWKGYLMAHEKEGFPLCIAELTPEAYRDCAELQDRSRSLLGAMLTLKRLGDKPNGKVAASVRYHALGSAKPSPIACQDALWDVWFSEGEARLTQARVAGVGINYQQEAAQGNEPLAEEGLT